MNAKALIPLVAGLAIGGFALKMGIDTLRRARGAERPTQMVQVWAARQDVPRGVELTDGALTQIKFPASAVPKGAITDKEQVLGRVPELDVVAGLPILDHMLLPPGERLRLQVKPGYRAVAVKIDEGSGVDYHLEPGCFVDVTASFNVGRQGGEAETVATTIIENVEVAAVGSRLSPQGGVESAEDTSRRSVRAVTLYVKPEDVSRLSVAERVGRIKLSLRGNGDSGAIETPELFSNAQWMQPKPDAGTPETSPANDLSQWTQALLAQASAQSNPATTTTPAVSRKWVVDIYLGQQPKQTKVFESTDSFQTVSDTTTTPQTQTQTQTQTQAQTPAATSSATPPTPPATANTTPTAAEVAAQVAAEKQQDEQTRQTDPDAAKAHEAAQQPAQEPKE